MTELLQEIQAANKCDRCGPEGNIIKCEAMSCPHDARVHDVCDYTNAGPCFQQMTCVCPSCTGGFIVPELEGTRGIVEYNTVQGDIQRERSYLKSFPFIDWLPSPTLLEVMNMLPPTIKHYNVRWWKSEDGQSIFEYSWVGNLNDCLVFFKDPNPLIAALKLLLWYIKQRKEGKV